MNLENASLVELPLFIYVKDACKIFAMTPREVWDLIAKRKINALRIGHLWKVEVASILKYYKKRMMVAIKEEQE